MKRGPRLGRTPLFELAPDDLAGVAGAGSIDHTCIGVWPTGPTSPTGACTDYCPTLARPCL